jgi:hypothetical protein
LHKLEPRSEKHQIDKKQSSARCEGTTLLTQLEILHRRRLRQPARAAGATHEARESAKSGRDNQDTTPRVVSCWPDNMGGERQATVNRHPGYTMPECSLQHAVPRGRRSTRTLFPGSTSRQRSASLRRRASEVGPTSENGPIAGIRNGGVCVSTVGSVCRRVVTLSQQAWPLETHCRGQHRRC